MPNQNDFLPFATAAGANVLPQAEYANLAARASGFTAGTAQSQQLNKVWRQTSIMAAVMGAFVSANGQDALDNGDVPALLAGFNAALNTFTGKKYAPINSPTLTGAPTTSTPPQFDNSQKIANTDWVKAAGVQFSTAGGYSSMTTLTAADVGAFRYFAGAVNYNVTMPPVSAVPDGAMIGIGCNNTAGITLKPSGSDKFFPLSGSALTSFPMGYGENVFLVKQGLSWILAWGTATNFLSAGFSASFGAVGYQRLPSGLIMQWGQVGITANGGPTNGFYYGQATYTFPLAFPNAAFSVMATPFDTAGVEGGAAFAGLTKTSVNIITQTTQAGSAFANVLILGN